MKKPAALLTILGSLVAAGLIASTMVFTAAAGANPDRVELKALSTDPAHVTGGDVLVEVAVPQNVPDASVKVAVGGRDVTAAFKRGATPHRLIGLVSGLVNG